MRQQVHKSEDLHQIPLSVEQARAILQLHERQASEDGRSFTLADIAETLDISEERARDLYRASLSGTVELQKHKSGAFHKFRLACAACLLVLLACLLVKIGIDRMFYRSQRIRAESSLSPKVTNPTQWLPDGFGLKISHDQGGVEIPPHPMPVEWMARTSTERLQNKVVDGLPQAIEEELGRHSSLDFPASVTVTLSTEAGSASFKVRTLQSAFPLTPGNPSSKKVLDDVRQGVEKSWDKLIPPAVRRAESQR